MRRRIVLALCLVSFAGVAQAQWPAPRRSPEPGSWTQLSVGLLSLGQVDDGSTGSNWDFGSGSTLYRATLEKSIQTGSAFGVAASYAPVSLRYTSSSQITGGCGACDASAQIYQALAFFHNGAGAGFHQVIELTLGATIYTNFRDKSTGAQLAPTKADPDLSFSFGYGFGYGLSRSTDLEIIQEIGDAMHQKTNLPSNSNSLNRLSVTRIGLRMGM